MKQRTNSKKEAKKIKSNNHNFIGINREKSNSTKLIRFFGAPIFFSPTLIAQEMLMQIITANVMIFIIH